MLPVNNTCEEDETGMRRVYIRKAQREMREGQMEGEEREDEGRRGCSSTIPGI